MVVGAPGSAGEQNQPEIQPGPDQGFTYSWYQHAKVASLGTNRYVSCSKNAFYFCFCFPIHSIE